MSQDQQNNFGYFGEGGLADESPPDSTQTEVTSTEAESTEENRTEENGPSFISVDRTNPNDLLDNRRVTYPDFGGQTYSSPPSQAEQKKKVGYYVRQSVHSRLDKFHSYLDHQSDMSASKSEIVEAAVDFVLREWEANGKDSLTIHWLRRKTDQ